MALALTKRDSKTFTGIGTGSVVSNSFTPSANCLLCVDFVFTVPFKGGDLSSDVSISGGGLTWTPRKNLGGGDWSTDVMQWTAPVGSSPASMTVSIDGISDADELDVANLHIVDLTGYDTGSPIGATGSGRSDINAGSFSFALDAAPDAASIVLALMGAEPSTGGITAGTGWTEQYNTTADYQHGQTQSRTGSTSTTVLWDGITAVGNGGMSAVAIEIKAAAGGSAAVDGDLQAQAATIDGIVNVIVTAAADLQAQNAQIAGTASVAIAVTGALEAQAAAISGAVSVIVTVDGDLQAQTASIAGAISALITIDGDLNAQASQISGIASIHIAVDGDLEAQAAQIDGTILTGTPISGALAAQDAFIAGIVTVNIALLAAIQAQNAQTAGAIAIALASGGSITSQNASIDGSISTELLRPPKNTFVKRAGWGRSARFWVERDR